MRSINRADIECAILATFLYANEYEENLDYIYKLDISIFTTPYRKRIAEKINGVKDGAYGFLSYEIEELSQGTVYEDDFLRILEQTSLSLEYSKKFHDELLAEDRVMDLI